MVNPNEADLNFVFADMVKLLDDEYQRVLELLEEDGDTFDRKSFALKVKEQVTPKYQSYMFTLADGRDISDKVWKALEVNN